MDRQAFRERLTRGTLLGDGGLGTSLVAAGVPLDSFFDELNLSNPAVVEQAHRSFVFAGADFVETNTFGANRYKLTAHGLEERIRELIVAAVGIARRAGVYVAGSMGPLGVRLAPYGRVRPADARDAFAEQAGLLAEAGADFLIVETHADLAEAEEAVRAALETGLPVVATMSFTRDDRTLLGSTPEECAAHLATLGVDALGVNCSEGPEQVLRLLETMRPHAQGIPLTAQPNAGGPSRMSGRLFYPATPEYFADFARQAIAAGVAIVGGCCGTDAGHIRAMAGSRAAGGARAAAASATEPLPAEEETEPLPAPFAGKPAASRFAATLTSGRLVITVEMDPPRGSSLARMLAGADTLRQAGADAIDVADSPMARMRMSPWAACHLIQDEAGIETVLHFPTRGRNLLRVQGDLLAAYALGVRNIFACMGDPTAIGDYPNAADTMDVVPSGLVSLVKSGFNEGLDRTGASIGEATSFVVGCALNPNAEDLEREVTVFHRKIESGADFALTQPIFDLSVLARFRAAYEAAHGPVTIPLLVGLLPLVSARHAEWLHNEVPGIDVPEAVREALRTAGDKAEATGLAIASDLSAQIAENAAGIYLMPPFGRYDLAADVIERARDL
ncbi:MAG TPA: bifunctional homocysteine S-methyltransferase/methylenetetrahydrofolate reductase [Actinomycetota bacterium]|nr:bifunctional homocysteine S-methyltransferase/methylenetetrahydrofolate reductase [Actinomycetota bacterium]